MESVYYPWFVLGHLVAARFNINSSPAFFKHEGLVWTGGYKMCSANRQWRWWMMTYDSELFSSNISHPLLRLKKMCADDVVYSSLGLNEFKIRHGIDSRFWIMKYFLHDEKSWSETGNVLGKLSPTESWNQEKSETSILKICLVNV
jgi:hypothetical protein